MVPLLSRVFLAGLTVAMAAAILAAPPRPRVRPRGHAPTMLDDVLIAGDGVRLPMNLWQPSDPPEAIVLGLHGYGDYRRAFRLAGPWFGARGIALYAYDQRGFGETDTRGQWPGAIDLTQDLAEAVGLLRARHPDLPLILLGESMGGAVALAALGQGLTSVDRLILAAPAVRGGIALRQVHDLALRLAALALPWLAVALRRGARPWLEPGEAARLADDPLILRHISLGTYDGLIELATQASIDPATPLPPTLLLYGELDATIPKAAIDDLAGRLDGVTVKLYPERHHLLLHETTADAVFADCLAWLDRPA